MHLKRIEVYGFKSFADKLCLNFNDGVTCIVGPNGCGKSNVSDAIRWVLGEQRASDLRTGKGNKMDQVIFKGTSNRKPMGYCEVSLAFENMDRTLPLDTDEVVITRKMWKTGESEYYINGQRDKLKNLINLFRDTGIGKDGYSVIGQGKIDSFLTAKPEDRRQIFEEAAGISKYKASRNEALKSLEKTRVNLDLTAERLRGYEDRMEPLEKQAITAIRAGEIKARIKDLEVNHFLYVTENSESESRKLTEKLKEADGAFSAAKKEQEETNAEYETVSEKLAKLDDEFKIVYERMVRLTDSSATKNSEQKRLKENIEQTEKFIEEKQKEVDDKQKISEANTLTKNNYSKELEQVTYDYLQAKSEEERLIREYEEADERVKEKRTKIDITNSIIFEAMDESISMTGDVAQLKAEKISLEKTVEESKEELVEKKKELAEVNRKLKAEDENIAALEKDRAEKKAAKSDIEAEYNKKFVAKRNAEDKLAEIRDTITQKKTWITYQENSKANFSNYDQAVKFLMTCGDASVTGKICGVVGDLITVLPKYALAVEIGLGNNINNMVTRNQQDTSFLIEYLNRFRGGRGTFLPLTAMRPRPLESVFDEALEEDGCYGVAADLVKCDREYRPAIEVLLGRVVVVEDKPTAIRMAEKYRNAFRIVTLTGENYAVSGAVTGGRTQSTGNRMLSLEAEIAEYKKKVDELEKSRKLLADELNVIDGELKEMEKTSSVIDNLIFKLDKNVSTAEQSKQYTILEQAKINSDIDKLSARITECEREIASKTLRLESEQEKMGTQTDKRTNANDMLAKMNEEVIELEGERQKANARRTDIITKVKNLENRSKELANGINTLDKEIARLGSEILSAVSLIKIRSAELERNRAQLEKMVLENSDNEQLQKEKEKRDAITEEKASLTVRQSLLYNAMQTCADKVTAANERKARAETMIENLKKEIDGAREKVKEEYGLDYETACAMKIEGYSDAAGVQETKNLKKELAKLGDVNEMAVSDLATLKEEYAEVKIHYDDVVKARDMLNDTIKDLTTKMETNFSESFAKIKENFASVFSEMFDGGKGRLDLDTAYGESVLDAGIIIEAEPPGKKLQNIDLLSGGERALTAIAIIFAIIKLNPVPFCILDEVDAPLDDSNSSVYAKYLRKFSRNTQFIIVSHRKPTMELANELYGITMQEKGVSKVFSVKLSEALQIAEKANNGG